MKALNFIAYLKERFPVMPLSLFAVLTLLAINTSFKNTDLLKIISLSIIYVLFLFHLRILDEFKDFTYDNKYHPDRPVQNKIVSLKSLKIIDLVNLIMLILISLFAASLKLLILVAIVLLYTGLMFKEFFIGEFLRKRPILYLVSHQFVLVLLYLFFYSVLNQNRLWLPIGLSGICLFIYIFIPVVLLEIGRKIKNRYNQNGQKTDDTYAFLWGEENSLRVFSLIILFSGLISLNINHFPPEFSLVIILSSFFLIAGSFSFPKFIIENHMLVTSIIVLGLPLLLVLGKMG